MSTYGSQIVYAASLDESSWRALADERRCECDNCGWRGGRDDAAPLHNQEDWLACQDGDDVVIIPEGECPECAAPVYNELASQRLAELRHNEARVVALRAGLDSIIEWCGEDCSPAQLGRRLSLIRNAARAALQKADKVGA